MRITARQSRAGLAGAHLLCAAALSGCAILQGYNRGITPVERLKECRLLDRKVTEAGQLNAVGTFLAGSAGLAAGVTNGDSEIYGITSGVFGLFAAWAAWAAGRHNGRYDVRNCQLILNPDVKDLDFQAQIKDLQKRPYALDSLDRHDRSGPPPAPGSIPRSEDKAP